MSSTNFGIPSVGFLRRPGHRTRAGGGRNASTVTNPVIGIETQAGEDYSSSLNSLTSTAITSMIVDEGIDLDQAFEEFVSSWYSSGGQEWTDQLNEGYQSQNQ